MKMLPKTNWFLLHSNNFPPGTQCSIVSVGRGYDLCRPTFWLQFFGARLRPWLQNVKRETFQRLHHVFKCFILHVSRA